MLHFLLSCLFFFSIAGHTNTICHVEEREEVDLDYGRSAFDYVTVTLMGQFGNQLFQIATAYAYALDHNLPLTIPDLRNNTSNNIPYNAKKLFSSKVAAYPLQSSPLLTWREPTFNYHPIPAASQVSLFGYFQSDKYFRHRREELLHLFTPSRKLRETIFSKHPFLASDALVVGVQIRDYRQEYGDESYHPTKKRSYFEKAMSYFPDDAIFVVSTNNQVLARECTEGVKPHMVYLQENDYIEEFYTLTFCKSFIISNSSFGWWAAWLSTHPNKVIIAPSFWFNLPYNNAEMTKDLFPEEFTLIHE